MSAENYREQPFLRVYAPNAACADDGVQVKFDTQAGRCYNGIHTYNSSVDYEVIDLKISEARSCVSFIKNVLKYLASKVSKRGN